jgi:sigma-B regulation protein RsbU (phosphoserine phosphatase)
MRTRLQSVYPWLGRVGVAFLILLAGYIALRQFAPQRAPLATVFLVGAVFTGIWLAVRILWRLARYATWGLRNRLLITYLFIAVVPILLIAGLAITAGMLLTSQLAVYLETSELDRRIDVLQSAADSIAQTPPAARPALIERMIELFYRERYPGIEVLVRDSQPRPSGPGSALDNLPSGRGSDSDGLIRYPGNIVWPEPRDGWSPTHGVLQRAGRFYMWCYNKTPSGDITITAPLTGEVLAGLVPDLGVVGFFESQTNRAQSNGTTARRLPEALNRFDREIQGLAFIPTSDWDKPGRLTRGTLSVQSRISAVWSAVFNHKADTVQDVVQFLLIAGVVVFFVVEIISLMIGITMTRTITGAVHRLYDGTQRVIEGDFSHRIQVEGTDQLAELSVSFNTMTENLEKLLVVAKEKERLQSEIEIAREVQSQLYPRVVPRTRQLNVTAICHPARIVSGDYYDYELIRDSQIALAIGDVAGKGISAALLMATLQGSLRTQLQAWLEVAAVAASAAGSGAGTVIPTVSTSQLVSRLNNQLHSYTSPEKYATFLLGVYDEPSGSFTYTNAGHLPPVLVRDGAGSRLDVNGTVVGAFPFSVYGESRVDLRSGDLLVCFTDGVTEPENEYGEMFGEDRLTDLVVRNAHRPETEIIDIVLESVRQWTASEELQDDMTMLLARRL